MSHTDEKNNKANERNPVELRVSPKTGEILGGIYEGDTLSRENLERKEYIETHILKFQNTEGFVKAFPRLWFELYHKLSSKEAQILFGIIPFVSYSNGILRYKGKLVDIKTISELLDENYDVVRRTIKSLIQKGILAKTDIVSDKSDYKMQKCYVVNPYIFFKGTDAEKRYAALFIDTEWCKE